MDVTKVLEFPVKEFFKQPRGLIGPGAWEMAGPEAAAMGLRHVLIVTTGLRGTGIVDEVKGNFEAAGVAVTVYADVETNPKDYNVMDSYKAFAEGECDGFVSLGGGSAHDCAKGARIVAAHDGRNTNEFQGEAKSEKLENPPQIAINTTVGTGSETTPFYVITDTTSPNAPHKWVGVDRACTTTLAINDPVLMMTQPPEYVAYTGFDTLAHASECYAGRVQNLSCTPLAIEAIRLTSENLREAYANPKNYHGDDEHDLGAVHRRPGVLLRLPGHPALALARRLRLLRHPPRAQQRHRHLARVDLQPAGGGPPLRRHRPRDGGGHHRPVADRGLRPRDRGGHPARRRRRHPRELRGRSSAIRRTGSGRAGTRTGRSSSTPTRTS